MPKYKNFLFRSPEHPGDIIWFILAFWPFVLLLGFAFLQSALDLISWLIR
jgi:hypothetical protein